MKKFKCEYYYFTNRGLFSGVGFGSSASKAIDCANSDAYKKMPLDANIAVEGFSLKNAFSDKEICRKDFI